MKLLFSNAILAITLALAPAWMQAGDVTPDKWGQTPAAAARQKADEAVKISATDPAAAEKLLIEARDAAPDYYRAQLNLGLMKLAQNNNKEAAVELQKALELQAKLPKKDPSIYAELGFANHRADRPKEAAAAFVAGVQQIQNLSPTEQKKLLVRGASFYFDYQQIQEARALVAKAAPGLDQKVSAEVNAFLDEAITKLTQNDPAEGWMKYGKEPVGGGEVWPETLCTKTSGAAGAPKEGDVITPKLVVNMRADRIRPENKEGSLARQIGFARVGEKFTVLEVYGAPLPDGTAWWVRVRREK